MEKRNLDERDSERVKVDDDFDDEVIFIEEISTVRLKLMKDINLKIYGPITRMLYTFSRAGAEVDVDSQDAEIMIKRMGSNSCCSGNSGPTAYFEVVR